MESYLTASIYELAKIIRTGQASCEEIVQAHISRIEQVNPMLNAVICMRPEQALAEAYKADEALARGEIRGPLHGVPMTIKDSFDTKDIVSTAGTKGRSQYMPLQNATVVDRLCKAGAILIGKTNTPELTLAYETDNLIYGRTNNPHDLNKTPGGSSGGAAAIVAAGGSPFDIGSDTGGSIRLPAHFCGVAGLKPTQGRVPRTGHIISHTGYLQTLTHIGPITRSVNDLSLLLQIISGPDWRDPHIADVEIKDQKAVDLKKLRVVFYTEMADVKPVSEIEDTINDVARALLAEKARVEQAAPDCIDQSHELYYDLFHADGNAWVRELLASAGTTETHPFLSWAANEEKYLALSGHDFANLLARWDRFRSKMLVFMQNHDAIICPVNAFPAIPHGTSKKAPYRNSFSFTITYNLTGWPAAVVRAGTASDGLPIGVQIVAAPWREDIVLAIAQFVEKAMGKIWSSTFKLSEMNWELPPC
ncbi:MAG: amidase [bacterium]